MRKRIIDQMLQDISPARRDWLDLERLAQAEITSEDPAHPIESALRLGTRSGWRAAQAGEQTIRLVFDQPLTLTRILLTFQEQEQARTQEFGMRWLADGEASFREIVRQQYNFSPPSTTREIEDYGVALDRLTVLELRIVPDINQGSARASLTKLLLA